MPPYLRFTALSMPSKATRQPMPPFYDAINRCHHDSPLPMPNKPHVNRCHHSTIHRCQMSNTLRNRDASHNSAICTESDLHSCFSIHDTSAAFELPHLHSIRQH
jgi:hypothetical protein